MQNRFHLVFSYLVSLSAYCNYLQLKEIISELDNDDGEGGTPKRKNRVTKLQHAILAVLQDQPLFAGNVPKWLKEHAARFAGCMEEVRKYILC
jgi:hypothetical protein